MKVVDHQLARTDPPAKFNADMDAGLVRSYQIIWVDRQGTLKHQREVINTDYAILACAAQVVTDSLRRLVVGDMET